MSANKQVPLERDWKHWKELHEMSERRRENDIENLRREVQLWMQHAITLGRTLDKLMSSR